MRRILILCLTVFTLAAFFEVAQPAFFEVAQPAASVSVDAIATRSDKGAKKEKATKDKKGKKADDPVPTT